MITWLNLLMDAAASGVVTVGTVYGLSRWLGEVWKTRILEQLQQTNRKELEALKSEMQGSVDKANRLLDAGISKSILVTRTQFETEFNAYKEIFAALSDLKICIHATRPSFIIAGEEESVKNTENLMERLTKLITANNKAVVLADNIRPFYQDEVYNAIQKCFTHSKYEVFQIKTGSHGTFSVDWFEEGRKRQESFTENYLAVSQIIRERIASLSVMPG